MSEYVAPSVSNLSMFWHWNHYWRDGSITKWSAQCNIFSRDRFGKQNSKCHMSYSIIFTEIVYPEGFKIS